MEGRAVTARIWAKEPAGVDGAEENAQLSREIWGDP